MVNGRRGGVRRAAAARRLFLPAPCRLRRVSALRGTVARRGGRRRGLTPPSRDEARPARRGAGGPGALRVSGAAPLGAFPAAGREAAASPEPRGSAGGGPARPGRVGALCRSALLGRCGAARRRQLTASRCAWFQRGFANCYFFRAAVIRKRCI